MAAAGFDSKLQDGGVVLTVLLFKLPAASLLQCAYCNPPVPVLVEIQAKWD